MKSKEIDEAEQDNTWNVWFRLEMWCEQYSECDVNNRMRMNRQSLMQEGKGREPRGKGIAEVGEDRQASKGISIKMVGGCARVSLWIVGPSRIV